MADRRKRGRASDVTAVVTHIEAGQGLGYTPPGYLKENQYPVLYLLQAIGESAGEGCGRSVEAVEAAVTVVRRPRREAKPNTGKYQSEGKPTR